MLQVQDWLMYLYTNCFIQNSLIILRCGMLGTFFKSVLERLSGSTYTVHWNPRSQSDCSLQYPEVCGQTWDPVSHWWSIWIWWPCSCFIIISGFQGMLLFTKTTEICHGHICFVCGNTVYCSVMFLSCDLMWILPQAARDVSVTNEPDLFSETSRDVLFYALFF